jgi:hypothetical protein
MQTVVGMTRLRTRHGASLSPDPACAVQEIRQAIDQPGLAAVILFCSPAYDLERLGRELREAFPCPVIACTSAGQIGLNGYQRGGITAASLASDELEAHPYLISPLSACREHAAGVAAQVQVRLDRMPSHRKAFGFLLVDGLALAEEALAATLYQSLGDVPIVGGSAGDDLKFERTSVYWNGEFLNGAAVFTVFETSLEFSTLKVQHFRPTEKKLITTAADPAARIVKEINGFPAAEAYAEVLGLSVEELDSEVFSANPVMLRIGDDFYVRSIAHRNPDLSLTFYCAIDEGLVLSVGELLEPLAMLEEGFQKATRNIPHPTLVIGCDCVLRRLELEQRRLSGPVGDFLASRNVIGFSSYGEQFNAVHVNQTFTGIVLGG